MGRRFFIIAVFIVATCTSLSMRNVSAVELGADDSAAIHKAVELQLDALATDDAYRAFSLATAAIREQIGSPEQFLRIIKEKFNPMYRHRFAFFSKAEVVAGAVVQMVNLTDDSDHVWLAIFVMERDTDGAWKIDNCQLLETSVIAV